MKCLKIEIIYPILILNFATNALVTLLSKILTFSRSVPYTHFCIHTKLESFSSQSSQDMSHQVNVQYIFRQSKGHISLWLNSPAIRVNLFKSIRMIILLLNLSNMTLILLLTCILLVVDVFSEFISSSSIEKCYATAANETMPNCTEKMVVVLSIENNQVINDIYWAG